MCLYTILNKTVIVHSRFFVLFCTEITSGATKVVVHRGRQMLQQKKNH